MQIAAFKDSSQLHEPRGRIWVSREIYTYIAVFLLSTAPKGYQSGPSMTKPELEKAPWNSNHFLPGWFIWGYLRYLFRAIWGIKDGSLETGLCAFPTGDVLMQLMSGTSTTAMATQTVDGSW